MVPPALKHFGKEVEILKARKAVYEVAKAKNPNRWSGDIRNWNPVTEVYLNPLKNKEENDMKKVA